MAHLPTTGARRRLTWIRLAVLATAPFGLVCGGATSSIPGSGAPAEAPPELLTRDMPAGGGPLSFPPPDGSRRPRADLDEDLQARDATRTKRPDLLEKGGS